MNSFAVPAQSATHRPVVTRTAVAGVVAANVLAAVTLAALLALLGRAPAAAAANSAGRLPAGYAPVQPAAPTADVLEMAKYVTTGSGDNSVVFNGDLVTYTIVVTNPTSFTASDINVIDTLPIDTLDDITCLQACDHIVEEQSIPEPLGGTLIITVTRQLSWTVASLPPSAVTQLSFRGRVTGQADGTVFNNRAFATYQLNGGLGSAATNETATTVRIKVEENGEPGLSRAPTWFSADLGGTLSQDWGDFNNDGYLDLVLGSSIGTSVYRNVAGRLVPYWSNNVRTYGVRWADFNGDGKLDIVAVGDSIDGSAVTSGTNYLYTQGTGQFVPLGSPFLSQYQFVRVAVGDFDGDRTIDLIASTNTLNAACPVRLLHNTAGTGVFTGFGDCLSTTATAALGAADFDNDGDLDLALGLFPDTIEVLKNNGEGVFNNNVVVATSLGFLPYDFAWGDYDGNGFMDLAAAFPLQKEARIYRNLGGNFFDTPLEPFRTAKFLSPLAVDWGDFSGDGLLDLVVADETPRVFINNHGTFDANSQIAADALDGQVWSIRGAQLNFGGDLDISLTNRDDSSLLIEGFAPHLDTSVTPVDTSSANSITWGDLDSDGDMDLAFGAGPSPALGSQLYFNLNGTFPNKQQLSSGLGPQSVALGDVNNDGRLDIAVGTAVENQLYLAGRTLPSWTSSAPNFPSHRLAFGDANSDGRLDLLVGANGGGVAVYLNTGSTLASSPVFVTPETGDVRAVAWGDFNRDFYLDFVVAFYNQPARLYLNNQNNTFTSVWNSGTNLQTTSLSVADFNGDSYPDLALGNYDSYVLIFENLGAGNNGQLSASPVWTSPETARTTAVAWGDWDYDGYPDLAVGNDFEPNQVYGNFASTPGNARLFWLWTSDEAMATTGLAWGDYDGDGDLDLGISQKGGGANGYYRNGTITPSHLNNDFVATLSRPNNPSYVAIDRPGATADAYLYSTSEIVGGLSQTVPISYTLFDPDGSRKSSDLNAPGNPIARTLFEFSLDGGSTWKTATPAAGWTGATTTTTRLGQPATFLWDATKDQAISDDARFRVRIVPQWLVGPAQHASTVAVSPPFRIRAVTCVWPQNPFILTSPAVISPNVSANYLGGVQAGTGVLTYTWNFGDGTLVNGQNTQHTFSANGTYPITLTVSGQPCPKNRPVTVNKLITVGTGQANPLTYLPMVLRLSGSDSTIQGIGAESTSPAAATTEAPTATQVEPTATNTTSPTETTAPSETAPPTDTAAPTDTEAPSETPTEIIPTESATPEISATETPTGVTGLPSAHFTSLAQAVAALGGASQAPSALASTPQDVPSGPLDTTQITTLTTGINNEPAINADGTRIIFWSTADPVGFNSDGNIEVFLLTFDGGGGITIKQISNSTGSILGGFNLSPSIDDDGNRMVFFSDRDLIGQNPDNNFEIFMYEAGTDTLYQVTNTNKGFNILPTLSGDGQYLAFASDRDFNNGNSDGNTEIFRAKIDAGGVFTFSQITNSPGGINDQPRINHDGTRIAFVSTVNYTVVNAVPLNNADNNREVYLAEVGTPIKIVQVTNTTTGSTGEPTINGDGTRVAFVSDRDPTAGPGNPSNLREIYFANVSPSYTLSITPITTGTVEVGNAEPSISADGSRVAFVSPGLNEVRLFDTLITSELISTIGASLNPSLSADGTVLVFAHNRQLYISSSPIAELMVSNVAVPSPVFENQPLRFTVVVSNAGPSTASNIRITDTLPASGYSGLVYNVDGATCSGTTTITCTVASLTANTAVTLTIDLTPTVFGTLSNTVNASTTTYERFTNNTVTTPVTVSPVPLQTVVITGPTTGTAHSSYTFIANVTPVSPSLMLTYTWQASGQSPVVNISPAISDSVSFNWNPGGVKVITVTVSNPASPVVSDTHTITINNPTPTVSTIQPTTATLNSTGFTLTVTGTGYVANSSVLWDAAPLTTTYVNSTTLQATVPTALLTVVGTHSIQVSNPTPGGGTSNSVNFTVNYPAPVINNFSPTFARTGQPSFTLVITGNNFITGTVLHWSGQPDLSTFGFGTSLTATIPASYLQVAGSVSISVTNPTPNNGPSNVITFNVNNPTINLTPSSATIGINGTQLFTATINNVQAADRTITLTSSLPSVATVPPTVTLPAGVSFVTFTAQGQSIGGQAAITATLPASLGGASDSSVLTVNYPQPTLTAISPSSATAGGLGFTLTLTGTNFISGASVYFGNNAPVVATGSGTQLTANIPAGYLIPNGTVAVTVTNPSPNFGASGSQNFTINPLQITLSPDPVAAGARTTGTVTITVNAQQASARSITIGFAPSSLLKDTPATVTLPANTLQTTFIITGSRGSNGVLTATLPANLGSDSDAIVVVVSNPDPTITTVTPATTTVGNPNYTVTITGTGFVDDSQVWFDGNQLTDFGVISSTLMTATIPTAYFPVADTYNLQIINPTPGGGSSSNFVITVNNPVPTTTSLSPTSAIAGSSAFSLTVNGTGFINGGSTVQWNGANRSTVFVNSTQLLANIPATDIINPGTVTVTVFTTGSGASNGQIFTINTSQPVITSLSPTTRGVLSSTFTLTVNGSGYVNPSGTSRDSEVQWSNGSVTNTLTTNFVSSNQLTATVSSGLFPTAGIYTVTVFNPDPPGGQLSNSFPFTVTNPVPVLSSLNPTFTVSGDVTFTLRVTGTNFISGDSAIYLNGGRLPNQTFLSNTSLTATVPMTYLETAAFLPVTVQTAGPGGGTSNSLILGVDNQPATLTSMNPVSGTVFTPINLDVFGTNIAAGSQLRWNSTTLTTTIAISSGELIATVPIELFPVGGVYTVTIISPTPPVSGVISTNALTMTVYNPVPTQRTFTPGNVVAGTAGFTVTLDTLPNQPSYIAGIQANIGGTARATQYISSTQIKVGITTADIFSAGTLPISATNPAPNIGTGTFNYTVLPLDITLTNPTTTTLPTARTITATVSAAQAASRVITLTSSDPTIATVPPTVTLSTGNLNVPFSVTGSTSGTITVTATLPAAQGGLSATTTLRFVDAAITGLSAADSSPTALGNATAFTATISAGTNISYSWDFGDAATAPFTTSATATHTYAAGGFYTATVTARNSAGQTTATTSVEIDNPDPTITTITPVTATVTHGVSTTFFITGTNFVDGALVRLTYVLTPSNSTDLNATVISSTRLNVAVPGSATPFTGIYQFFVVNPSPPVSEPARRSPAVLYLFL